MDEHGSNITISLCMIVKNEEEVIGRCLESVKELVDEIIVVDTGSTDKTKEIVAAYTNKIYDFEWIDDFSAARNFSFSKASKDYILILDADDIILEEDALKFKELKANLSKDVDVVYMKYNVGFDSNGKVTLSYYRERLSKRSCNFKWVDPIHEYLAIYGKTLTVDICISHFKVRPNEEGRNLKIFEKMISEGRELSPRNLYYYARELYYHARFKEAEIFFNKFLATEKGWVEDIIGACFNLANCYKNLGKSKERLQCLIDSFKYELPRGEICSQIGYCYMDKGDYQKAIFWFELVLNLDKPKDNWGFLLHDYWDYIPYIELCVCYYKLGNISKAINYNEMAAQIKPNNSAVLYNQKFFEDLKVKSQSKP